MPGDFSKGVNDPTGVHPDFTTGSHTLQSSDEVCFKFDLNALAPFSSFFSDLVSLPSTCTTDESIPLPSATTRALHFTLHVINCVLDGCRAPSLDKTHWDIPILINEIMLVFDAYDLPILPSALLDLSQSNTLTLCKLDQFALARLCDDKQASNRLTTNGQLISSPTHTMSSWAMTQLEHHSPRTLTSLDCLNQRWVKALDMFEKLGQGNSRERRVGANEECPSSSSKHEFDTFHRPGISCRRIGQRHVQQGSDKGALWS